MRPRMALLLWLLGVTGLEPSHHRERIDSVDTDPHHDRHQRMSPGEEAPASETGAHAVKPTTASAQKLARSLHGDSPPHEPDGQVQATVPAQGMPSASFAQGKSWRKAEGEGKREKKGDGDDDNEGDDDAEVDGDDDDPLEKEQEDAETKAAELTKKKEGQNICDKFVDDPGCKEVATKDECHKCQIAAQAEKSAADAAHLKQDIQDQIKDDAKFKKLEAADVDGGGDARTATLIAAALVLTV